MSVLRNKLQHAAPEIFPSTFNGDAGKQPRPRAKNKQRLERVSRRPKISPVAVKLCRPHFKRPCRHDIHCQRLLFFTSFFVFSRRFRLCFFTNALLFPTGEPTRISFFHGAFFRRLPFFPCCAHKPAGKRATKKKEIEERILESLYSLGYRND